VTLMPPETWSGRIFDGSWRRGGGGEADVTAPAGGEVLERIGVASADDVRSSAAAAVEAQRRWMALTFEARAAVLRRAGDLFYEHAEEIHDWIVREAGSTRAKAAVETNRAAQECYEAAMLPSMPWGEVLAPPPKGGLSFTRRVPAGPVAVIAPFNYPLILAINGVAPALACGNAVILKPDVRTTVSGAYSLARVFEEAGLPAGVLQVLPGGAEVGEALVTDPDVHCISFTGSTATGRRVAEAAAKHLKRVHLELGGNNAMVVLEDADLDRVVSAAAWGSFLHQGQICMTTGRHIVHERIAEEYVERLAERARALKVGDPEQGDFELGPLIDAVQRDKVHSYVTASVEAGAKVHAGAEYDELYYQPTVLSQMRADMPAWQEEIFGPVAPVMAFSSFEDAARIAADTRYGLILSIVTPDVMKGMELAARIPSGAVHINDQTVGDDATIPFGGVNESGNGARFGGPRANIEAFTELQWVTMKGAVPEYPF
jgi:benzaldehyde dehydrogenase (NAD)